MVDEVIYLSSFFFLNVCICSCKLPSMYSFSDPISFGILCCFYLFQNIFSFLMISSLICWLLGSVLLSVMCVCVSQGFRGLNKTPMVL